MNILYLCDEYPPGRHGGIGTSVQLLARQMVKMGHRVVVAGFYSPGYGGSDEFDDEGVKVYRYRWGMDKLLANEHNLSIRILKRFLKISGFLDRDIRNGLSVYSKRLEELITLYQVDIIEMPDYNDYIRHCGAYIPFPKLSVPYVVKMNGSITYFNREANMPLLTHIYKMEREIINGASAVAAVSKYTANKSADYFEYQGDIAVIPNGINTAIAIDKTNKITNQVIFTGTLVEKKGIHQLAKAWNIVNSQMPDAMLLVLGKGERQKIIDLLDETARKTATFMGHIDKYELYGHLTRSAVAVFPSYAEAFALAPLEAMACGTAVLNSARTSGPELVENGVNGLLIDPDDVGQIAATILQLLNDLYLQSKIASAGNQTVKDKFDIKIIADKNIAFYNKVIYAHSAK